MAGLLVSVRSAAEARSAVAGGATIVDVKEPGRGPLGRADPAVWRAVRTEVPDHIPMSVALGELRDMAAVARIDPAAFERIAYRKIGLADSGRAWAAEWAALRRKLGEGPRWVAVAYADWWFAKSPRPDEVLDAALDAGAAAILVDTFDKSRPSPLDLTWSGFVAEARARGLKVALAGGLDEPSILRLAELAPDWFAVRGAACDGADRRGTVNPRRVARLVLAAARPAGQRSGVGASPKPL